LRKLDNGTAQAKNSRMTTRKQQTE